eukprot:TRINITY_DN22248_c0_g1_i1.p1 TRINITY_DN22248_c0_g1~~TRINITY_DN22248_c0_g1_i1.p1  ORF type:complete len:103 (-),score=0.10 TRINITY_DN22248_c0_g1_i1:95-403(-)
MAICTSPRLTQSVLKWWSSGRGEAAYVAHEPGLVKLLLCTPILELLEFYSCCWLSQELAAVRTSKFRTSNRKSALPSWSYLGSILVVGLAKLQQAELKKLGL